jgi:hypothetical protein
MPVKFRQTNQNYSMSLEDNLLPDDNSIKRPFRIDWEDSDNADKMLFKHSKLTVRQRYYNFVLRNKWYFYMHLVITLMNVVATIVFATVQNVQLQKVVKEDGDFQSRIHNGFGIVVLVLQFIVWIDNLIKMIILRSWWFYKNNTLQARHILDTLIIWGALFVDIVLIAVSNAYITRHFRAGNPDPVPGKCDNLCVGSIVGSGLGSIMILRLFIYMSWTHEMALIIRGIRKSIMKVLYMFALYVLFVYLVSIPVFMLENPIYGAKTVNGTVPLDSYIFTQKNFGTLYHSFLTLIQTATTDDWALKMQGSIDHTILTWAAPLIYIPFLLIAAYLILNIVTGIVIQSIIYQGKQPGSENNKSMAQIKEEDQEEEDSIYEHQNRSLQKPQSIVLKDYDYRPPRDTEILNKLLDGLEKMNKRMDLLEEMIKKTPSTKYPAPEPVHIDGDEEIDLKTEY